MKILFEWKSNQGPNGHTLNTLVLGRRGERGDRGLAQRLSVFGPSYAPATELLRSLQKVVKLDMA
ncbi:MAG: hypothetical protein IPK04_08320 [Bdellovibrionales bacterium]|nr:hypothetical protein [Bdellovibrionales bacterium]